MNQDSNEPVGPGQPAPGQNPYAAPSFPFDEARGTATQALVSPLLEAQVKSAASWFYWIAGLSLVNSAIILFGGNWNFVVGLGLTQVVDTVAKQIEGGGAVTAIAIVFDLLAAGVFVVFGLLARRMMTWPFILGMVLYALDGLLLLYFGDLMGVGFHAFALFQLFTGVRALRSMPAAGHPATM